MIPKWNLSTKEQQLMMELSGVVEILKSKSDEIEDFRARLTMLDVDRGSIGIPFERKTIAAKLGIHGINLIVYSHKRRVFLDDYLHEDKNGDLVEREIIENYIESANFPISLDVDAGFLEMNKKEYVNLIYDNFYFHKILVTSNEYEPKDGDKLLFYFDMPILVWFYTDMSKYKKYCYQYDFYINPSIEIRNHYKEVGLNIHYIEGDAFDDLRAYGLEIEQSMQESYGDWVIKHSRESRHKQYY